MSIWQLRLGSRPVFSDATVVRSQYRRRIGRPLDLKDPKAFHEKICWLRLNRMTPLHSYCADKLTVACYVASVMGPGYTVRRFLQTDNPDRIDPGAIPATRLVLKTNHASGGVLALTDSQTADWPGIRRELSAQLRQNYYWKYRESQYRTIPPRVLVEDFLDQDGLEVGEMNFYCLNGIVRLAISFPPGAILRARKGVFIDRDGHLVAVSRMRKPTAQNEPVLPRQFLEMRAMAEKLASPFAAVRVDFLIGRDNFYLNELTFTPLAGYESFVPHDFELKMGALLDHQAELPDWRPILDAAKACEPSVLPPFI